MSELAWQKSSFSGGGNGECVELAVGHHGHVHLRESDRPDDILTVAPAALRVLVGRIKGGELGGRR
jgi:hypothetical protein